MKELLIVALIVVGIGLVAATIWPRKDARVATPNSSGIANQNAPTAARTTNHNHEASVRVPAHYKDAQPRTALRPTLAPEIFTGNVRQAYQVAEDIPQVLAQLPCYCHCDMSEGHKSLHSCFEDEHGANCGICIGEALMAYNLQRQGLTGAQIRERIMQAYGGQKH